MGYVIKPLKKDEIETEEISKIHLNVNQPPNQLQHQSITSKAKKRKLSSFSKVNPSPDNELEPYWKKKKLSFKFSFSNVDTLWIMAASFFSKRAM